MSFSEILPYLLIAPISAGVGWITNMVGIKMMFYPVNFVGIGNYFGWQGIIPRLRVKLTRNIVNMSVATICTPAEMMDALDDSSAAEYIEQRLAPYIDDWIEDILNEENITGWQIAPYAVKQLVYSRIKAKLPEVSKAVFTEFSDRADSLIDITALAEEQVRDRPELLNDLFMRTAGNEIRFMVNSGLYFGFPLGCIQALTWYLHPVYWVLPAFGVLVGAGTNWIAINLLSHPANPIMIGKFKIQGLYLRRQAEVSVDFAENFTRNFLSTKGLVDHIWTGPKSMEVHRIIHRQVRRALDKHWLEKMISKLSISKGDLESVQKRSVEYAAERFMDTLDDPHISAQLSKPIVTMVSTRMAKLEPKEFQQLLLPAFEEDQVLVIILGGVLGGLIGFGQLVWFFGGSMISG